jgi:hypothetical protein
MKRSMILLTATVAIATLWAVKRTAAGAGSRSAEPATHPSAFKMKLPPHQGTETGSNGGGSRGANELPAPELFAPANDTGQTISTQPVLYFYLPEGTKLKGVLTMVETRHNDTWFEISLDDLTRPGVYSIDTSKANHPLEAGVIYLWSISIDAGDGGASHNAYAGGFITYDGQAAAALTKRASGLDAAGQAALYGDHGEWYDAIAALEQSIAAGSDASIADLRSVLKQYSDYADADHFSLVPLK